MKYPMYSIRDAKTSFFPPVCSQNEEESIRQFSLAVNSPSGVMGFSPKDFDLYQVGEFNTSSGVIDRCSPPKFIISGVSLVMRDEK